MDANDVVERVLALYDAANRAEEMDPDLLALAEYDYGVKPVERRSEAGFSIGFPAGDDGAYAVMSIGPSDIGVDTRGRALLAAVSSVIVTLSGPDSCGRRAAAPRKCPRPRPGDYRLMCA